MGAAIVSGKIPRSDFDDLILTRLSLQPTETFENDGFAEMQGVFSLPSLVFLYGFSPTHG